MVDFELVFVDTELVVLVETDEDEVLVDFELVFVDTELALEWIFVEDFGVQGVLAVLFEVAADALQLI